MRNMSSLFSKLATEKNKISKRWRTLAGILAVIVTFVTTYSLILPAITVSTDQVEEVPGLYPEEASFMVVEDDDGYDVDDETWDSDALIPEEDDTIGLLIEDYEEETETEPEGLMEETDEDTESVTSTDTETLFETTESVQFTYESEAIANLEMDPETDAETEVKTETEPAAETEVETESESEIETDTETEAETEVETETEAETETETEPETEVETEPDVLDETETETETQVQILYPEQTFIADDNGVHVVVTAPEGAFPEGTTMTVQGVEDEKTLEGIEEAVQADYKQIRRVQAVDICFRDAEGTEIEPKVSVNVCMITESGAESERAVVVHVDDAGSAEAVEDVSITSSGDKDRIQLTKEGVNLEETETISEVVNPEEAVYEEELIPDEETAQAAEDEYSFETEQFSVYAIVYTVDFHYEANGKEYDFIIPGGGFVSLEHVVEVLGIGVSDKETDVETENVAAPDESAAIKVNEVEVSEETRKFVSEVESVEFSSPELVWVGKADEAVTVGVLKEANGLEVEYSADLSEEQIAEINAQTVEAGDWALINMHPFASEETLTVTMKNGDQFVVNVTDAQIFRHVITARGETFEITVTYTDAAEIPETAELYAREITEEEPVFEEYRLTAGEVLGEEPHEEDLRLFDISILDKTSQDTEESAVQSTDETTADDSDGDMIEIEPKAPVHVYIQYLEGIDLSEDQSLEVVHFAEDGPEHLESVTAVEEGSVSSVDFVSESFSAFATIRERITEQMADGCIAYFSFDNTEDGFSSAGATATRNGNTSLKDGQSGTALYLNGDGWLNVTGGSDGHLLTGLDEFTVSFWSSATEATSDGQHGNWAYYAAPNSDGQVWRSEKYVGVAQTGNNITAERYNNNNNDRPQSNTAAVPMNEWHHVTVIYKNGSTQFYVDGQMQSEVNSSVDLSDMLGSTSIFQIGRANWGGGEGYRGYIDEFSVFNHALNEEEVRLLHENAYYQEAKKISAQNLQNNKSYIIYNEVWNPNAGLTGAYEYYAIDGNGNLVKVYNKSDLIHYRSDTSLEWKLIAYEENGQETGYYEFYNEETGKYLAPQEVQLLSDEVIGLLLKGKQDGQYESTIEAWDGGAMSYYGYKYVKEDGQWKLKTASESEIAQNRDWEFFFAEPEQEKPVTQLETVETVQNPSGLTIRMFDYPSSKVVSSVNSSSSTYQDNIMGGSHWHNQHVTTGLVNNTLVNGYPWSVYGNQSMSGLFSANGDNCKERTVDHLFIKSTYDESGYYEYSSFENYAYLGDGSDFTVYKQLGAQNDWHEDYTPSTQYYSLRGNFMPYNNIDPNSPTGMMEHDYQKNMVDEFGNPISEDDPRYGETLYRCQGNLNYHFGMNITADFLMANGGDDDRGNPITFEFNGDDDMWVFVDGVLLLDMGGEHNAHSGSINFETGRIVVQNSDGQNVTTIKECYHNAHVYPDGTPWPEGDNSLVDKYFRGDTYVDYSAHQLQMYFMERGGGCSNLHVKFNLPILEPGTLRISKELEDVDPRYAHETYQFQICRQDGTPITNIGGQNDDIISLINENTGDIIRIDSQGRFSLKAGETAVASLRNLNMQYLIKEIGMNPDDYDVTINGQVVQINNGEAVSSVDTAQNRPSVVVKNKPKQLGALRITKQIEDNIYNPASPRFEFYVYFEDQNGEIVPYSQGIYYVVKGNQYCEYNDGNLVELPEGQIPAPFRSGQYGTIGNIPAGYCIYIPNLVSGTHFLVEERRDNMPEGYVFVKKELTAGSYDTTISQNTHDNTPADGRIKAATTADVTVTNRDNRKKDITIKKVAKDKVQANPTSLLDGATFKIEKYISLNPLNKDTAWNTAHSSENIGQDGIFTFQNLPIGYYKIVETNMPAGYVKLENDPVFQIAVNGTTGELEVVLLDNSGAPIPGNATEMIIVNDETIIVGNEPGVALPNTGGPGTRLFTILGSILAAGAGLLLWRRRRLILQ